MLSAVSSIELCSDITRRYTRVSRMCPVEYKSHRIFDRSNADSRTNERTRARRETSPSWQTFVKYSQDVGEKLAWTLTRALALPLRQLEQFSFIFPPLAAIVIHLRAYVRARANFYFVLCVRSSKISSARLQTDGAAISRRHRHREFITYLGMRYLSSSFRFDCWDGPRLHDDGIEDRYSSIPRLRGDSSLTRDESRA
jgi:hypothetical protein